MLKKPDIDKVETPNNQGSINTNSASKNWVESKQNPKAPTKHNKIITYHYACL